MLLRLVRPVRRKESSKLQFVQRIPADVRGRAVGLRFAVPLGDRTVPITISPRATSIRFSLRTRDPSEAKVRQAVVTAHLEKVWRGLRQTQLVSLTPRQATALAGELYRAWAGGEDGERSIAFVHDPVTGWEREWNREAPEERQAIWEAIEQRWEELNASGDPDALETALGPLVDRLLLAKGIAEVDTQSRRELLSAFSLALRDAFANRKRNAGGDYAPDPKSERFPEWQPPGDKGKQARAIAPGKHSLTGLVEDWWREAKATGLAISTYESYRNSMKRFVAFLGHDDASRVTADDVIRFKDKRLAEVNPKNGKPISPKTVKDSDLAALKSVFRWAVSNRRMASNPAEGVTVKIGKQVRARSKGFTEREAKAVLAHALNYSRGSRENAKTFAAKRWAPWLCAYTGARVGEILQLRKEDVRREGDAWIITVTPEAGTVKTKEAREIPLHAHLVELGFVKFVTASADDYLFFTPSRNGDTRGRWQAMKNRVREFVRQVVTDPNVMPSHAWRHLFKTIGFEAGIQERVLDAICGHAPKTVGATYGEVTIRAKAEAIRRFPRFVVEAEAGIPETGS